MEKRKHAGEDLMRQKEQENDQMCQDLNDALAAVEAERDELQARRPRPTS